MKPESKSAHFKERQNRWARLFPSVELQEEDILALDKLDIELLEMVSTNDPLTLITKLTDLITKESNPFCLLRINQTLIGARSIAKKQGVAKESIPKAGSAQLRKLKEARDAIKKREAPNPSTPLLVEISRTRDQSRLLSIAQNDMDAAVRREASKKITQQDALFKIATNDKSESVRKAATEKLTDQGQLVKIARKDKKKPVRCVAIEKLNNPRYIWAVVNSPTLTMSERFMALEKLDDDSLLADTVARGMESRTVSHQTLALAACQKISDETVIANLALTTDIDSIFEKITNQDLLNQIALKSENKQNRIRATKKLTDARVISKVAARDRDDEVRKAANKILSNKPVAEKDAAWINPEVTKRQTSQSLLEAIAKKSQDVSVRQEAIHKIKNQALLLKIATKDGCSHARKAAVEKLRNQGVLKSIALTEENASVRQAAIGKIGNQAVLKAVISKEKNRDALATTITK